MPGIRPLETLHNALSLRQLDSFLGHVTSATFKSHASSSSVASERCSSSNGDEEPMREAATAAAAGEAKGAAAAPATISKPTAKRPPPLGLLSRESSESKEFALINLNNKEK